MTVYQVLTRLRVLSYEKFKYLITNNRNAFGLRNRFCGDVATLTLIRRVTKLIDWWIGEDGAAHTGTRRGHTLLLHGWQYGRDYTIGETRGRGA